MILNLENNKLKVEMDLGVMNDTRKLLGKIKQGREE